MTSTNNEKMKSWLAASPVVLAAVLSVVMATSSVGSADVEATSTNTAGDGQPNKNNHSWERGASTASLNSIPQYILS